MAKDYVDSLSREMNIKNCLTSNFSIDGSENNRLRSFIYALFVKTIVNPIAIIVKAECRKLTYIVT